jgi:predicted dehydrogenase
MKVALIGCGKQAPKHLKGLQQNQIQDFILYDPIRERARELAEKFNCKIAENLDDIFADNSIKAIDICTPVEFHKELAVKAILCKKHFFCEKPLTTSWADDNEIKELAAHHKVVGMVGYIYRFSPVLQEVKKILSDHVIGDVHAAVLRIGGRGNHAVWKHLQNSNGGALNEMAVHMIDLALWYFGNIKDAHVLDAGIKRPVRIIENQVCMADAEDFVLAKLNSEDGTDILLMADFLSADFTQHIEIQGSNGSVKASIQSDFAHELHLINEAAHYPKGKSKINYVNEDLYKLQMKHFLHLIAHSNATTSTSSLEESCKVIKINNNLKIEVAKKLPGQFSYNQKAVQDDFFE